MEAYLASKKAPPIVPPAPPLPPTAVVPPAPPAPPVSITAFDTINSLIEETNKMLPITDESVMEVGKSSTEASAAFQGWKVPGSLLSEMDSVVTKANEVKLAMANISMPSVPSAPVVGAAQSGGLVTKPGLWQLAEHGTPEMVIPMEATQRSRDLLAQATGAIGVGNEKLIDNAARSKSLLESVLGAIGIDLSKINVGGVNLGEVLRGYGPGAAGAAESLGKAQEEIFHRMQGQGGGGGINLSMNSPITINGVNGDQAGSIGKEVQDAMASQTTYIREMLVQLMKAKDEERRMSYV
jgi:hypothetical protein